MAAFSMTGTLATLSLISSSVFIATQKRDEISLSNILVADHFPVTKSGFGLVNFG
jgi:hypothetical protein